MDDRYEALMNKLLKHVEENIPPCKRQMIELGKSGIPCQGVTARLMTLIEVRCFLKYGKELGNKKYSEMLTKGDY